MRIENNKFYFSDDDCISFDNLIILGNERHNFIFKKPEFLAFTPKLSTKGIELHIYETDGSDFDLSFTDSVIENKRIYLETLRKLIDRIYIGVLAAKKHGIDLYDDVEIHFSNFKNVLTYIYNSLNKVRSIVIGVDCIADNAIITEVRNSKSSDHYFIIEDNKIHNVNYIFDTVIHYPNEFEQKFVYTGVGFEFPPYEGNVNFISKSYDSTINIRSDITQSLLTKFVKNIDILNSFDKLTINNEYDFFRYL